MSDTTLRSWLAEHGFTSDDLNALGPSGLNPLMRAARLGDANLVDGLLQRGARLETRNTDGNNALWFACVGEHHDMIALLVKHGIDIDNQNDNGATCLMYASSTGKDAVVKTLLAHGANAELQSLDDFTALDVAATIGCLRLLRNSRPRSGTSDDQSLVTIS
jgi:thiosulfate/3-mercaptopyruvate sulfurtransferase